MRQAPCRSKTYAEHARIFEHSSIRFHGEAIDTRSTSGAYVHDILPSRFRCVPIMQADLRFITSQQQSRIDALQQENDALRARLHDALVQNGIVLPSGHEVSNVLRTQGPHLASRFVAFSLALQCLLAHMRATRMARFPQVRWHGRKEHMKAHSPVGAASDDAVAKSAEEAAAQMREGGEMESELEDIIAAGGVAVEPIAAARQVRAAAVQASHLQKRLDDATKRTSDLESQLAAAAEKAEQRDRYTAERPSTRCPEYGFDIDLQQLLSNSTPRTFSSHLPQRTRTASSASICARSFTSSFGGSRQPRKESDDRPVKSPGWFSPASATANPVIKWALRLTAQDMPTFHFSCLPASAGGLSEWPVRRAGAEARSS